MRCSREIHGHGINLNFGSVSLEHIDTVLRELVAAWLRVNFLVVALDVSQILNLALLENDEVNVGTRAKIVVHTSLNSLDAKVLGLFLGQIFLESGVQNTHSSETTRAEGKIRRSERVTVSSDLHELRAAAVNTSDNKVGTNVTTISEDVLDEARGSHLHSAFCASVHSMQLKLSLDHLSDVVAIGGRTGTSAVNVGSHVMQLGAVFVGHSGTGSRSRISSEYNTVLYKLISHLLELLKLTLKTHPQMVVPVLVYCSCCLPFEPASKRALLRRQLS